MLQSSSLIQLVKALTVQVSLSQHVVQSKIGIMNLFSMDKSQSLG